MKVITSPVKRWPGTVTLAEPLTFPQFAAWKNAVRGSNAVLAQAAEKRPEGAETFEYDSDEYNAALEPGILACIESVALSGLPSPLAFLPATPIDDSQQLVEWLRREIAAVVRGEEEIPNA